MSFFTELKRRNVFRVAITYLAGAWLLTEVSGTLFPGFGIPDWAFRLVVILLALGFIPVLVFSWAYEMTPEGLKREEDLVHDTVTSQNTARRLDWLTIGLIVVALGFVSVDHLWLTDRPTEQAKRVVQPPAKAKTTTISEAQVPLNSIAVLPFANRSADPNDAYFVDGIHDDLLTHIARIGAIKTISRTSVMHYRDSTKTIPEIAHELGVTTVLEGGVQRAGEQVRINVQLIDAQTDEHLWAEIYDRKLTATNIFAIQSEIAESVSAELKAVLSPAEIEGIQAVPTSNLEAYEAYLLGKQRFSRRNVESITEAIDYFREAVEMDSGFALAWIGLADAYIVHAGQKGFPIEEARAEAETALKTALETNQNLGEAYTSLCGLRREQLDYQEAKRFCELALNFSPNYPPLSRFYSILQSDLGNSDEAIKWRAKAVELDPMSAELRRSYAVALREANRIEEAIKQLNAALEIEPNFAGALDALATIQWQQLNRLDKAANAFTKIINLYPKDNGSYVWLEQLYFDLAEPKRARVLIDRAVQLAPEERQTNWGKLLLHINDKNNAGLTNAATTHLANPFGAPWHFQLSVSLLSQRAIAAGRPAEALALYSQFFPELTGDPEPGLTLENYRAAIDLAWLLQKIGDQLKAAKLLRLSSEYIQEKPRLGWWGGFWISDVQILALQGKKSEASVALHKAISEGWRSLWWYYLQHDPNLDSIRGEPEFQRALAEIRADVSTQMGHIKEMEQSGEMQTIPGINFDSK